MAFKIDTSSVGRAMRSYTGLSGALRQLGIDAFVTFTDLPVGITERVFTSPPDYLQFSIRNEPRVVDMNTMIDEELRRLHSRLDELTSRIIPDFENRTQMLYQQIMPLAKGSEDREKLESEYTLLSKELRLRSDELFNIRQQIENLEVQKSLRR